MAEDTFDLTNEKPIYGKKRDAQRINSTSSFISDFDNEVKSTSGKFKSSVPRSLERYSENSLKVEKIGGSNRGVSEVNKSVNTVLKKMGYMMDELTRGVTKIVGGTVRATGQTLNQWQRAVREDIDINKKNLVAMGFAKASPIFGYMAAKLMETDIFKRAKEKIQQSFLSIFESIKEKIKEKRQQRREIKAASRFDPNEFESFSLKNKDFPQMAKGGYVSKGGAVNVHPAEIISPVDKFLKSIGDPIRGLKHPLTVSNTKLNTLVNEQRKTRFALVGSSKETSAAFLSGLMKVPAFNAMNTIYSLVKKGISTPIAFLFRPKSGYYSHLPRKGDVYTKTLQVLSLMYVATQPKLDKMIDYMREASPSSPSKKKRDIQEEQSRIKKLGKFSKIEQGEASIFDSEYKGRVVSAGKAKYGELNKKYGKYIPKSIQRRISQNASVKEAVGGVSGLLKQLSGNGGIGEGSLEDNSYDDYMRARQSIEADEANGGSSAKRGIFSKIGEYTDKIKNVVGNSDTAKTFKNFKIVKGYNALFVYVDELEKKGIKFTNDEIDKLVKKVETDGGSKVLNDLKDISLEKLDKYKELGKSLKTDSGQVEAYEESKKFIESSAKKAKNSLENLGNKALATLKTDKGGYGLDAEGLDKLISAMKSDSILLIDKGGECWKAVKENFGKSGEPIIVIDKATGEEIKKQKNENTLLAHVTEDLRKGYALSPQIARSIVSAVWIGTKMLVGKSISLIFAAIVFGTKVLVKLGWMGVKGTAKVGWFVGKNTAKGAFWAGGKGLKAAALAATLAPAKGLVGIAKGIMGKKTKNYDDYGDHGLTYKGMSVASENIGHGIGSVAKSVALSPFTLMSFAIKGMGNTLKKIEKNGAKTIEQEKKLIKNTGESVENQEKQIKLEKKKEKGFWNFILITLPAMLSKGIGMLFEGGGKLFGGLIGKFFPEIGKLFTEGGLAIGGKFGNLSKMFEGGMLKNFVTGMKGMVEIVSWLLIAIDAFKGIGKGEEWGVSSLSSSIGAALAGTEDGGTFKGMLMGALKGVPFGPWGIGVGAVLGLIGGENVSKVVEIMKNGITIPIQTFFTDLQTSFIMLMGIGKKIVKVIREFSKDHPLIATGLGIYVPQENENKKGGKSGQQKYDKNGKPIPLSEKTKDLGLLDKMVKRSQIIKNYHSDLNEMKVIMTEAYANEEGEDVAVQRANEKFGLSAKTGSELHSALKYKYSTQLSEVGDSNTLSYIENPMFGNSLKNNIFGNTRTDLDLFSAQLENGSKPVNQIDQNAKPGESYKNQTPENALARGLSPSKDSNIDKINPSVYNNLASMGSEYFRLTGDRIQINQGYRTFDQQQKLFREKPGVAVPPGHSLHQLGLALDINSQTANKLDNMGLLQKYGFTRPMYPGKNGKSEPWHIEPIGAKDGGFFSNISRNKLLENTQGVSPSTQTAFASGNFDLQKTSELSRDKSFGWLSRYFESGGKSQAISKANEYGLYQFTTTTVKDFLNASGFKKDFNNLSPGTSDFNAKWVQASSDPKFVDAQHSYVREKFLVPQLNKIKAASGIDFSSRNPVLLEEALSTAIQYGPRTSVISSALKGVDPNISDSDILLKIGQRKSSGLNADFSKVNSSVRNSVGSRINREISMAINEINDKSSKSVEDFKNQKGDATDRGLISGIGKSDIVNNQLASENRASDLAASSSKTFTDALKDNQKQMSIFINNMPKSVVSSPTTNNNSGNQNQGNTMGSMDDPFIKQLLTGDLN